MKSSTQHNFYKILTVFDGRMFKRNGILETVISNFAQKRVRE